MIIKINYNKSTKQITLSNDIENNLLSLIDSKKMKSQILTEINNFIKIHIVAILSVV